MLNKSLVDFSSENPGIGEKEAATSRVVDLKATTSGAVKKVVDEPKAVQVQEKPGFPRTINRDLKIDKSTSFKII